MRLWLDDNAYNPDTPERLLPSDFDCACLQAKEAINLIGMGFITHISFDHDLGDETLNGTGYDVAKFIEAKAYHGEIPPLTWTIHSANPVGRDNIKAAMESAERFWARETK
jgi:hypothetical protein